MQNKKILLTSGSWQSALACTQSLGKRNHDVYLIDEDPIPALASSRFCKHHIISPLEKNEDEYIKFLIKLLESKTYDVLIPISENVIRTCSKHKKLLEPLIHMAVPDYESLCLASEKNNLYAFAEKQNIAIPKTYFPKDLNDALRLSKLLTYPCVIKLPISIAGKGVFYVHNERELQDAYQTRDLQHSCPVIQELIEGDFYGFNCVALEGKIVSFFMYKTERKYSLEGIPPILFSVTDNVFLEQARNIIHKLGWTGAINLDFLKDPKKGYVLLEVNPRFGGSLNFAYRMGVDLPWIYCQIALGMDVKDIRQIYYSKDIMFRTILPTEIVWSYTNKEYRKIFFKNFFRLKNKSNIYWDDLPMFRGQINETRWFLQDIKKSKKKV